MTSMITPTSHHLARDGFTTHYLRWGEPAAERPSAVLMHGLGFVGGTWTLLARELARDYTVYALDRRGHGRSEIAAGSDYTFAASAGDLVAFLDALDIRAAYGIGHSSGATDLLIAAGTRPAAFARVLAVEPTARDPRAAHDPDPTLSPLCRMLLERTRRRRGGYPSRESAFEGLHTRSPLKDWHPEILRMQVEYGFRDTPDGGVELCCQPATEAEMLIPIFQTMENRYPGSELQRLLEVTCPVLVTSADGSDPIYAAMAAIAARVLPNARHQPCRGVNHFWPQERPETFAERVMAFAAETA
jgi:pimeloyl-ACP methyl ester carboxylesterase